MAPFHFLTTPIILDCKLFHVSVSYALLKVRFYISPNVTTKVPIFSQKCKFIILSLNKPLHIHILPVSYSNSQLLILNNRYYLAIGSGAESSSGLFKTSRSHNKLTSDFPSSEIHFRDPAQFEVDTTTESFQGSFNHRNFEV